MRVPTLMPDVFEELDIDTAAAVLRVRYAIVADAGFGMEAAVLLAVHPEIDIDRALGLLRRGCPAETAVRILQ